MAKENEYLGLARKSYQELTFTDDFMFRKVMRNNEALCRGVIELQAKAVSRWEVEYMTFADELRLERKYAFAEGHAEGHAEGLEQGREGRGFEAVDALVASGLADDVRACEILGVDLDAYKEHNTVEKSNQIG